MSVRSRLAPPSTAIEVAKTYGTNVPESFRQGEIASQMTPTSPFSPGQPIGPYDGYDRHTRQFNYTTGYNISTRPRLHEAVSFSTLTGLVEAYDVAQIVIWHRIDSIRSLDWKLLPADHVNSDVTGAVPLGVAALRKPDRKNYFKTWLAKYLYDVLAWDAGTLFRLRNRAGKCIGLQPVDGRTLAPLLDYWGNSPDEPAEAYVQYVNGLPWVWLTRADIIYEPFRPVTGSPYGRPPIESVILNANTDLRFQTFFLQRFTDGNIPAAFASAPDSWSPDQIEQFQALWDSYMFGDQSRKHQVRWMPPGSKFVWSNEKDFSDAFSMYLLQKTCAAYHVVPSDLGLTQDINRSSGESQADVQHRVGDLPLMEHIEGILSAFLCDDLGLPLKFEFDRGEEQVDQLAQAQADQAYMDRAVISPSEIRELRYGLTDAIPVPRAFFTTRAGPIPLSSLMAVAGAVDPMTAAPEPGAPLPHQVFEEAPGVAPNPPLYGQPLAEEIYGPKAIPANTETQSTMPVAKEGEGAGITSDTGLYSYDLEGRSDEDEGHPVISGHLITETEAREAARSAAVKSELAAFRRFERTRRKSGEWRDFRFSAVDAVRGHNLNDCGRLQVRKDAGEVAVAGLAVLAADTGRVLMLQRALCDDDPAGGTWELPGGHIENGETPLQGAWREWSEETGCIPPPGVQTGSWISASGIYQGIVWTVDCEAAVPVRCDTAISNPDDPDGDQAEAIAWWNPADLPGNPVIRPELLADIDAVMAALGWTPDAAPSDGAESVCPCGIPVVYDEMNGWQHGDGSVSHDDGESVSDKMASIAKAGGPPKAAWPGWDHDLRAASYWAALLAAAVTGAIGKGRAEQMARAWLAEHPEGPQDGQGRRDAVEGASAWLAGWLASRQTDLAGTCQGLVPGITADGWLIGGASAASLADGTAPDWGGWQPGNSDAAQDRLEALGLGAGPWTAPGTGNDAAQEMASGFITRMARALVDGLAAGTGAVALGAAVSGALSDEGYANGSVLAQLVAAAGAAAMAVYLARKVQRLAFITAEDAKVCPRCEQCEADSPYTASNAPQVPQHPACRCALVPA